MRTRAKQKFADKAAAPGAKVSQEKLFVLTVRKRPKLR